MQSNGSKPNKILWISLCVTGIVLAVFVGGLVYSRTHPIIFVNPRAVLISENELAEKYGLQLTLTATTAMDSWVDVRFRVLDANKAQYILENPARRPVLRVEEGEHTLISTPSNRGAHHHVLRTGMIYYMLFPNQHHRVRPGTPVRVVFGDLVLNTVLTQ